MTELMNGVLEFVRENDVKFIRLGFCDLFGVQKNISIMPEELPAAFEHPAEGFVDALVMFRSL